MLENVRYGNLNATDEECIEAARQANIMKFFTKERMHQVLDVQSKQQALNQNKKKKEEKKSLMIQMPQLKTPEKKKSEQKRILYPEEKNKD